MRIEIGVSSQRKRPGHPPRCDGPCSHKHHDREGCGARPSFHRYGSDCGGTDKDRAARGAKCCPRVLFRLLNLTTENAQVPQRITKVLQGWQPGNPNGHVRHYRALRAKRNVTFLRATPWCLRVENAEVNPPQYHPGWQRSRTRGTRPTVTVKHNTASVSERDLSCCRPSHATPALDKEKALLRPAPWPEVHGAWPVHPRLGMPDEAKSWMAGSRPAMTQGARPSPVRMQPCETSPAPTPIRETNLPLTVPDMDRGSPAHA